MTKRIEMTGLTFGRLRVIGRSANNEVGKARWLCQCACGAKRSFAGYTLRKGLAVSCGCESVVRCHEMAKKRITHGRTKTAEFTTWTRMIDRCTNPKNASYHRYGARGITVCERWMNGFEAFLQDMGPKPFKTAQLDRRNNDLGYSPENCRWVTCKENNNNRSSCKYITFAGETLTLTQWSEKTKIGPATIKSRLGMGWTVERALTQRIRRHERVDLEQTHGA